MFKLVWYPILILFCWFIPTIIDIIMRYNNTSLNIYSNHNIFIEITTVCIPCSQGIFLFIIYWKTMKPAKKQLKIMYRILFRKYNNKVAIMEISGSRKHPNIIGVHNSNDNIERIINNNINENNNQLNPSINDNKLNQHESSSQHSIVNEFDIESDIIERKTVKNKHNTDISTALPTSTTTNTFTSPLSASSYSIHQIIQRNENSNENRFKILWNYMLHSSNDNNESNAYLDTISIANNGMILDNERHMADFF